MPLIGKGKVEDAISDLVGKKNDQLKAIFIKGLQDIAVGTPVDEGRARNSWFLGVNSRREGSREASKSGSGSISDLGKIPADVLNKKFYYINNMPYITKLEYGGFPSPAKNPQKTVGGFSDQAPTGWVRKELLTMRKRIRAIK